MSSGSTLGIDVSVWQDNKSTPQKVNFNKAYSNGARFVFIKSSQSSWMDQDFLYNWSSAKDANLLRGAYHFLTWDQKPELQADFFSGLLKADRGEIQPVLDFEWWSTTPTNVIDLLWAFIVRLKNNLNVDPIIYTAPSFWQTYGKKNPEWAKYPLWQAQYNVLKPDPIIPWDKWSFWQSSSHGDGLAFGCESLNVDIDYFNGSYDDLLAFCGISKPAPIENTTNEKINILQPGVYRVL
jgi:lysozyme